MPPPPILFIIRDINRLIECQLCASLCVKNKRQTANLHVAEGCWLAMVCRVSSLLPEATITSQ